MELQKAHQIVARTKARGGRLPRLIQTFPRTSAENQERRDAWKLSYWKKAVLSSDKEENKKCSEEIQSLLDIELPEWCTTRDAFAMQKARAIVRRVKERDGQLPRMNYSQKNRKEKGKGTMTKVGKQEHQDAEMLKMWSYAMLGKGTCKDRAEVTQYLDTEIPGWRAPKLRKIREFDETWNVESSVFPDMKKRKITYVLYCVNTRM